MNLGTFTKKIQNIMRNDSGVNGDAQRIEQMVWILFLKVYEKITPNMTQLNFLTHLLRTPYNKTLI